MKNRQIILLFLLLTSIVTNSLAQVSEGFEGTTPPPAGWSYTSVTHGTNNPRTGSRCATFNANGDNIITPLQANPNVISFWYRRSSTAPTSPSFTVAYSTSTSGPWTTIPTTSPFSSSPANPITSFTTTYQQFTATVSSLSNVYFRVIDGRSAGANEIYIDDFSITAVAVPAITLADNGTQITAASVTQGTTNHILHQFSLAVTTANATLTGVQVTTAGSYVTADLTNLKVRYSTDATLDAGDATLSTYTSVPTAGTLTFPSFTSQTINSGNTGYIFITADIAAGATVNNTISINAVTTGQLTFSSGTKSGSTTAGGTQTITASSAPTVTIDNTGAPAAGNIIYNTNDVVIGGFRLSPSASVDFTAVNIATSGTATTSDISNFELIYDADNSGTYNVGDVSIASVGTLANPLSFGSFSSAQTFSSARRYLIIADVATAATDGRTITASISAASNVTTTGNESGTATGNTQTIQAPEISVEGNSTVIASGDVTPSATDHTAFGNVEVGGTPLVRTFTIKNIGNQNLTLNASNPRVTLSGSTQFTVTAQPSAATISGPSGSLTFQITYTPTTYTLQTATVSIANNDANGSENPYTFDINGTGTSSSLSDIILSGMTYTSNIDYTAFQAVGPLTNTSGNVGVMGITIRDGGASSPDNDNLPTILNSITFSGITGTSMIRAAALFEGNALVSNSATINTGANTISFSGLTYSCTDNSTRDLTLRISFLTTVTDNLQMTFSVAEANVMEASSATSSQFSAFTTVNSSTTGDRNRIEVTASKLAFQQQPSTTNVGGTMSPSPTVRALDANNNLDLDYTTNVSITSTGTMTGSPISVAAVAGVATFSSVVHTVAGTGFTLNATSGSLTNTTSNLFDINTIAYVNGDYRTTGSGNWVSNNATPAIWERLVSGVWTASNSPSYATTNSVYIQNGHTITTGGSFGSSVNLKIMDGGTFNCNHSSTTASTYIYSNGTLNINASFTMASGGSFEVEDNGNVNINFAYSTPTSSIWQGTENFHPNSTFTFLEWDAANDILVPDNTSISTNTYNGYTAAFGNIIFDFGANLGASDDMIILESGVSINLAHGDVIFRTNDTPGADFRVSTTGTVTSGIGGDFIVEDTYFASGGANFITFKTSGTLNFTIKGNMSIDAGTTRIGGGTNNNATVNIDGNLEILTSAFLDLQSTVSSTSIQTINLKGDLYVVGSGRLSCTNVTAANVPNNNLNFNGTGDGLTAATTQTIDIASTSASENSGISFNVKSGAYVQLINRNFEIGQNSKLTVEGGGVFDFGFDGTTPLLVNISGAQTGAAFESKQASTLKITSTDGLYGNWNTTVFPSVTQSTGNLGLSKSNRTIDNLATFWYIGKANQQTGDAPNANNSAGTYSSTSNAKVVICDLASNSLTLTPSISFGVTSGTTVDATYGGHLYIKKGQFRETTTAYIFGEGGTLRMEPGTYYYIPKGNVDLATSDADPIPRMSGLIHPTDQYYLNGGTIELAGTGASNAFQSLRGNTIDPKNYINVTYSGANTYGTDFKNLTSTVVIDSALTITGDAIVKCHGGSATTPQSFTGNGGLVMNGTNSRLMIRKLNEIQPELIGDNVPYSLTGGTVEFYSTTATQQQLMRGNYTSASSNRPLINYYNIDINADEANWSTGNIFSDAGNVNMASSFRLTGTLNVNAPAVFRMDESDAITDGTGTSQVINIKDYAGLLYGSPNGIKSSGTASTDGNIRTSGTRNFSSKASYGFIGNGDMVSGSGLPATTNGLYVYKYLSSNKVTLTNTVRADSILKMSSGHIITGSNRVELGVDISNRGTLNYSTGYVVGNMRRWFNGTNSGNASSLFPLGQNVSGNLRNRFYNIQYTSAPTAGGYLDVNFNPVAMGLAGLPISGIPAVGTCTSSFDATSTEDQGYWIATPQSSALADGAYTLAITGEGFNTVNNLCELTLLKRVGTGNWQAPGNHLQPSGTAAVPTVSRSNISGFSNFGFGGGPANPLPVELISFTGNCMEEGISKISWSTASEFNSLNFIIQRSTDGVHYTNIATVPSAGNSNQPRHYSVYDTSVNANSSYYRLIETDIYGRQTIYSFIQVKCSEVNGVHIFYAEPKVIAEINSSKDKMVNFSVFEVSGKLIHQESRQVLRGYNRLDIGIKNKLAEGIYIIQMTDDDKISSSKIMVR